MMVYQALLLYIVVILHRKIMLIHTEPQGWKVKMENLGRSRKTQNPKPAAKSAAKFNMDMDKSADRPKMGYPNSMGSSPLSPLILVNWGVDPFSEGYLI